jgi:hypothetical protein
MSSGLLALAWVSSLQRATTSTEANGGAHSRQKSLNLFGAGVVWTAVLVISTVAFCALARCSPSR